MNMLIKRRQLVMATLVVALGSAVFVNWYFTNSDGNVTGSTETTNEYVQSLGEAKYVNSENAKTDGTTNEAKATASKNTDYFATVKLKRTKAHDEALENMRALLKDAPESSESAKEISESIDALSKTIKLEADIEALISAKLKCECVVMINDDNAEVVVTKGSLNESTILQITDAVLNNTEVKAEDIKISES
ncbi:MAG: SpoIIIAH-like family protein [Ruminococcaceae bacterium]|nr:SpoIIIAH-like family protein [Oscillospiraceae bacterium]